MSETIQEYHIFMCDTCNDEVEYTLEIIKAHLKEKHGVTDQAKGERKLGMHVDGREFYLSTYTWTFKSVFGEVRIHEELQAKRAEDDMMRFV